MIRLVLYDHRPWLCIWLPADSQILYYTGDGSDIRSAAGHAALGQAERKSLMDKIIITVVGRDTIGIIARVCTYLSDNQINILDISQTIVDVFFNMMVIADMSKSDREFGAVSDELKALGEEIGLRILAQKEEIFTKMHRI